MSQSDQNGNLRSISCTTTEKEQESVLPDVSVAVYVTRVAPGSKVLPGSWSDVRVTLLVSFAVGGVQYTAATSLVDRT